LKLRPNNSSACFLRDLQVELQSLAAIVVCGIILCSCNQSYARDFSTHITQYGHSVWRAGQDGLEGTPLSVAQTADGYIWVGTPNGLFRFDGVRFTSWTPQSGERLHSSYILQLLGARDGSLYVGTISGVARITNGRVYNYPEVLEEPGPFSEDAQGSIWMGDYWNFTDHNTMCKVGRNTLSCVGTKDGFICVYGSAVLSDRLGSVWIGSKEGICHWQQGKKPDNYPLPLLSRSSMGFTGVMALASTGSGALWAGVPYEGKGSGLLTFARGRWQNYITREVDGTKLPVRRLFSDHPGSLWIGTLAKGLYKLDAGNVDHFDTTDGLSNNTINGIIQDREGDIWVVTDGGVDMFRDLPVISYTARDGLPPGRPISIAAQNDGTVWIGSEGALTRYRDKVFSSVTLANGLPTSEISHLFIDSSGQLWVGGGGQLYLYKDNRFLAVKDGNNTNIGLVASMVEDRDRRLWVSAQNSESGRNPLLHVVGSRFVMKYEMSGPSAGGDPTVLAADPNGGIWVAESQHGFFHFRDGTFKQINIGGYKGLVNSMFVDPDGTLWIVTEAEGIIRYKDGNAQHLTSKNGLPCDAGLSVTSDHAGNHWFYMTCGIARVANGEINKWWKDPTHFVVATVFSILDGAEPQPVGNDPAVTPDGRIWSVNQLALKVIDPMHLPRNPLAPPVYVVRMVVDHTSYNVDGATRLQHSPREVEIDYSALSFVVPERVRFRYRLSGYDTEWTDAGTRRQAFYNDLRPGHYTFQVIACNNDGVWNRLGASITFTIPPVWYQTAWFRLLCVVLFALLAYAFYQSRLRRYTVLLKARFDERIEERTRLARDLHDTLLQTLQGSKLVADNALENPTEPADMRKALNLVSHWLERATVEGRAALNSLRSSTDEPNDLAAALRDAAENGRIGSSVKVAFVLNGTSRDMHPIVREEIYRIGCEAINNACVHSGGNVVTIELTYTQDVLLSVRDNGKGIEEGFLRFGKDGHFGIRGMRERADRVGAKLSLKTTPNGGTEVTLLVPGSVLFKTLDPLKHSKRSKPSSAGHGSK
jgi:signal transduction histidine kinase/ligand-binding sensor domain-containing protein